MGVSSSPGRCWPSQAQTPPVPTPEAQGRAAREPRRDLQGSSTSSLLPSQPAQRPRLKTVGRRPSKTLDGQGEMESNREISRFLLHPASAKSSFGKPPGCRALGLCADSPEVLDCGAWGKGAEGPCEILQGEEDPPPPRPRGLPILSRFLAPPSWRPATPSARLRSYFLLPGLGCLDGTREPSSAWLGSLRLAKEDSSASGLGSGADEGSRASCQETVSRHPRLRTKSNNPFRVLASFTVYRLTCMRSTT